MGISLLLKDYRLIFMSSTGIANLFSPSMIPKTDGYSMKKQDKTNDRQGISKELIFLLFTCWVVMPCKMEGPHLTGTILSQETPAILSQDWVFWLSMTKALRFGSLVFTKSSSSIPSQASSRLNKVIWWHEMITTKSKFLSSWLLSRSTLCPHHHHHQHPILMVSLAGQSLWL